MNTLFLDMILPPVAAAMVIAVCYLVSKIVLRITLKKTLEHYAMLYDMMDERDKELDRYHQMFGPLKDWEDSNWVEKAEKVRNGSMGPNEENELPF